MEDRTVSNAQHIVVVGGSKALGALEAVLSPGDFQGSRTLHGWMWCWMGQRDIP
jgi:hypothetical protein